MLYIYNTKTRFALCPKAKPPVIETDKGLRGIEPLSLWTSSLSLSLSLWISWHLMG